MCPIENWTLDHLIMVITLLGLLVNWFHRVLLLDSSWEDLGNRWNTHGNTEISGVSVENQWKLNGELENHWNIIRTSIEHQLPSASPISVSRLDRFGWFSEIFHRTWMDNPHFKSHPTEDVQAAEKLLRPGELWDVDYIELGPKMAEQNIKMQPFS